MKKKTLRVLALCLVIALLALTLTACGPSEEEVAGTYAGSYEYNGNHYAVGIVLNENGRYAKVMLKNGEMHKEEMGDWEVKGSTVHLYTDDSHSYHGTVTKYAWKDGAMENNDHYFYKK